MIHPHTRVQHISDAIGCGVFATRFIPKGTIVYVKDPLELEVNPEKYHSFPSEMQEVVERYSYINEHGIRIVSWDHGKYVNHCCNCNTISTGYGFEIAIRDIQPGEEITDEYGLFNLEYEMELQCSQNCCRGKISFNDLDLYFKDWDLKVQEALNYIYETDQPLFALIDERTKEELNAYLAGNGQYRSVKALKFDPSRQNIHHK